MFMLITSILILLVGYFLLSRVAEKAFGAEKDRKTPVEKMEDGIDFVSMPKWKLFLIELLNIAGLGPIFGAISGAIFGPMAFIWIVAGSLLIGGMHDYFSGMISLRNNGKTFAELTGFYLGKTALIATRIINIVLLILLGVVFIKGPSELLGEYFSQSSLFSNPIFWITLITTYVTLAIFFPIDKVIGKVYPIFGVMFVLMALGLLFMLIFMGKANNLPEFTFKSLHYNPEIPLWPILFITIACGAVSGFHATQTPLIARCLKRESPDGRYIFYGAMIAEAVIALAWAAASMSFFEGMGGFAKVMQENNNNPAVIVSLIANTWFGKVGGIMAILSVVVAPVTSAGSAYRVLRLSIADMFNMDQKPLKNRLIISIPILLSALAIMQIDFAIIWRYFAFTNQMLAMITLWVAGVYLIFVGREKWHWILTIPAFFMTMVVITYICVAPEGLKLPALLSNIIGFTIAVIAYSLFFLKMKKMKKNPPLQLYLE